MPYADDFIILEKTGCCWFKQTCCENASIRCMHNAHARIYESTQHLIYFDHLTQVDFNQPPFWSCSSFKVHKKDKMWVHYVKHALVVKYIQYSVGSKGLRPPRKCFCVPINNPVQVLIWSPLCSFSSVIKPKLMILSTREKKKARAPAVCELQQKGSPVRFSL